MKVVQIDDVPRLRGLEHRGRTFHSRTILEGQPGTPGNFKFSLSELGTDYSGPRHRHNFDQLRRCTTVFLEAGERTLLRAGEATELLHYGLPDLSDMAAGALGAAAQAAE
jgi:hypothetical protein